MASQNTTSNNASSVDGQGREGFSSRLGFLLISAGCAIGIGNVWRFPYITGQNGGGYFVLFYLICLVVMGIPVLTMELATGVRVDAISGVRRTEQDMEWAQAMVAAGNTFLPNQTIGKKGIWYGDYLYADTNGDGIYGNENDYTFQDVSMSPKYYYGFQVDLAWKGIDLSIFLQGVLKRDMMVRGELIEPFHSNYGYTMYEHQLDFWTPTNTDARWPRLTDISDPSNQNNYRMGSDLYMFDGSYLRLKNIQLGYTLPERISMKFGVKRFKIYFNAQNLLTFSNCSFIDPESSEFGSNMNSGGANSGRNYPNLRYFGAGLNITF